MASPKFKVLRRLTGAAGAPAAMTEGEIAANFVDNKVYIHNGTSAIPVAGKGEFVDLGSEQSVTGKKNFTAATVSSAPADANDVVRKTDLDTEVTAINAALTTETNARIAADDALDARIDALGSAFNYIGTINGGANAGVATDLSSLAEKDAGDYYKVAAAGHFVMAPAAAFFANANDGIVFNLAGGVDLIDNTNSSVSGTANEIAVTGSSDTGFTVALDAVFSGRMTTAESDIDTLEGRVTTAESDIDSLEGRMTTAESDIDALESTVGALGTMANQDADSVAITGGTIDGTAIGATTASTGKFTSVQTSGNVSVGGDIDMSMSGIIQMNSSFVKGLAAPLDDNDATRKKYVDDADSALSARATDLESKTQNIDLAGTVAGTTVLNGALEIGGAMEVTGNLVGTGTNEITDFIIDAGTF